MESKELLLTSEDIKKKYISQFVLVAEAIKLAAQMVESGRGARVQVDNSNPAVIVLEEIRQGKNQLEDLVVLSSKPVQAHSDKAPPVVREKSAEKKKPRRIMA